jgi:hypothetical protein
MNDRSYPIPVLLEMLREPCGVDGCGHCQLERQAAAEIKRLTAIVDRLPKYRDGALYLNYNPAPGVSGWAVWHYSGDTQRHVSACHTPDDPDEYATGFDWIIDDCDDECDVLGVYSTREAAEKARTE